MRPFLRGLGFQPVAFSCRSRSSQMLPMFMVLVPVGTADNSPPLSVVGSLGTRDEKSRRDGRTSLCRMRSDRDTELLSSLPGLRQILRRVGNVGNPSYGRAVAAITLRRRAAMNSSSSCVTNNNVASVIAN